MELFFGPDNAPMPKDQANRAREVCKQCPVWQDCLAHSVIEDEPYGIWAALSPEERRRAVLLVHGRIESILIQWETGEIFAKVVMR